VSVHLTILAVSSVLFLSGCAATEPIKPEIVHEEPIRAVKMESYINAVEECERVTDANPETASLIGQDRRFEIGHCLYERGYD
jgi:hypothetical protein